MSPNSHCAGADRISTAGWAVLSGSIDHACGKLASGPLNTCHETVEPRLYRRGSDRSEPDAELTPGPSVQLYGGTAIIGRYGTPRRITGLPAGLQLVIIAYSGILTSPTSIGLIGERWNAALYAAKPSLMRPVLAAEKIETSVWHISGP